MRDDDLHRPSVIIDNLHIVGGLFHPLEADSILVIDPDAVLPLPTPLQAFQPIAGRNCQRLQVPHRIPLPMAVRYSCDSPISCRIFHPAPVGPTISS